MNILFIASDNNNYSGAFLSMVTLCNILSKEYKHNISVILPSKGNGISLLDQCHIPYEIIGSYNWIISDSGKNDIKQKLKIMIKKGLNIYSVLRLVCYCRKHKIEIIHINTSYSYVGAIAARCVHVPYVWHIREFLEEDQNNRIWNRRFGYFLMSRADAVIAISNSVYQKYVKLLKTNNLYTILNGIDEGRFAYLDHVILCDSPVRLLMVGSIKESKGQEQLIEACLQLKERGYCNFKLKIVGTGDFDYVDGLRRLTNNNDLQSVIEFCGSTLNTQDYYAWADIAFVCSRMEAFGRVTVEAMMAGDLVIGADTGGTQELIEDGITGMLYKSGNVEDLTNKVMWIMDNRDQAKRIAKAGQKYVLTHCTAKRNASQVNKIYEKISKIHRGGV